MADRRRRAFDLGHRSRVAAIWLVVFGLSLTEGMSPLVVSQAAAQDRPRTIMDMLFGAPPARRYIDEPPPRRVIRRQPQKKTEPAKRPSRRTGKVAAPAAAAAVVATPVSKAVTARTVLVVGDFMAASLASGLEKAMAANPDLKVVTSVDGSSGLVRDDHFDWLARIGPLIDETKPTVVVAMLGSNDRQPLRLPGGSAESQSPDWTAEYQRRAEAFAASVEAKNVPLVWVGMPSFKFDRMSEDMAALNEVYRQAATAAGGEFVDVWDGFVDAGGTFIYSGPDIAGQTARLRNADGITMTPEGADKLAFFADKPISAILGTPTSGKGADAAPAGGIASLAPPPAADAATATAAPLLALSDPALDGGDALLGGATPSKRTPKLSPRDRLVLSGTPNAANPGRADDFDWSAKTTAVAPSPQSEGVLFRGSLDLGTATAPHPRNPPAPMPSLGEAIVEDWSDQNAAAARLAKTAPAAGPSSAASASGSDTTGPNTQRPGASAPGNSSETANPIPATSAPARSDDALDGVPPEATVPRSPESANAAPSRQAPVSASPFAEDQTRR